MNLYECLKGNKRMPSKTTKFLTSKDNLNYQMGICDGRLEMLKEWISFLESVDKKDLDNGHK